MESEEQKEDQKNEEEPKNRGIFTFFCYCLCFGWHIDKYGLWLGILGGFLFLFILYAAISVIQAITGMYVDFHKPQFHGLSISIF